MTLSSDAETTVVPSLRTLMAGIIDYAGLFPPAALPLPEAIRNFARYRRGAEAWMLSRFVLPVRHLEALAAYADLFEADPVFRFSVLGTGGDDADAFLDELRADVAAIEAFHRRHDGNAVADVMEVRLPAALLVAKTQPLVSFLERVNEQLQHAALDVFFEIPLDDTLPEVLPPILEAFAAFNAAHGTTLGFKMRTGGTDASAFPSTALVAEAITACREAGVRFKATAGLHHPLRHYNASVQTRMHGFFNVFGGAALAHAHALDAEALRTILLDEDAVSFRFDDDAFAYNHLRIATPDLARARATFALSFGSCSFDEPREDLQALGLL